MSDPETPEQFQALIEVLGSNPYTDEVVELLRRYESGEIRIDDLIVMLWDLAPPTN